MSTPSMFHLGRNPENEIVLDVPMVSGRHARLWLDPETNSAWIEDLNSANGVFLGIPPRRITRSEFAAGDTVSFGSHAVAGAWLLSRMGAESRDVLTFRGASMTIGRDPACDLSIDAAQISTRHARLFRDGGRVLVEDLGSSNGTSVNGRSIRTPTVVRDGDILSLGSYRLALTIPDDKYAPMPESVFGEVAEGHHAFDRSLLPSMAIVVAAALVFALILVVVGRMLELRTGTIFASLSVASVGFGLLAAFVSTLCDMIRRVETSSRRDPSAVLMRVAASIVFCFVSCAVLWPLVAGGLGLKAPVAASIAVMGLASLVGLALGGLIRAGLPGQAASIAFLMILLLMVLLPTFGLMPSRWAFEASLSLEPALPGQDLIQPYFPVESSRAGRNACLMTLGLMLLGLTASAAFVTWGPGSASRSKTPWPAPDDR